ncbi:A/G-specific adenine glycosylase [bacterium]|nr:A/G-specific adenine glycosylase [bacterium]MBU1989691.1 A/G-specific adenine glycosylase [bacterium]
MSKSKLLDAQKKLLDWYEVHGRKELPWRNTEDVYSIYVSEIMLQQTQVKRVMEEYYPQFLLKFPSLLALSQASLEEVFGMWSGLGYYRRAKNLHQSAILSRDGLPKDLESLQKLPGIGKYTASALCSFAYNQKVSVVDTNIARVLARYFGVENVKETHLWELAELFLNSSAPKAHNLALMDLGAMVCLPKNPSCTLNDSQEMPLGCQCPFIESCKGANNPLKYYKTKSKVYENKTLHFGICIQDGKIAMKTSTEGMYKDMLKLPDIEKYHHETNLIGSFKHSVTRYRLEVHVYTADSVEEDVLWLPLEMLPNAPISSMTQKALKLSKAILHD